MPTTAPSLIWWVCRAVAAGGRAGAVLGGGGFDFRRFRYLLLLLLLRCPNQGRPDIWSDVTSSNPKLDLFIAIVNSLFCSDGITRIKFASLHFHLTVGRGIDLEVKRRGLLMTEKSRVRFTLSLKNNFFKVSAVRKNIAGKVSLTILLSCWGCLKNTDPKFRQ